jgi:small subunit ribosomal protein S2
MQVVAGVLGRAGEAGQKQRLAAAAQGHITYRPADNLVLPGSEERDAKAKKAAAGNARRTGLDEIVASDELATELDDVDNREDHRVKGGRDL